MNDKNQTPEELLDAILFGQASEADVIESIDENDRERFVSDLDLHRSAAVLIQQQSVIEQVRSAGQAFLERRGAAGNKIPTAYGNTSKKIVRIFVAVAAVFIVTSAIIVLYWYIGNSSDRLFGERYQTYQVNIERSNGSTISPVIRNFQQKKFQEVIALHEKTPASNARDKMAVAASYMELNDYQAAVTIFSNIIAENIVSGNRLYHDEAEYYLALAYIKTNNYDAAYQLFDKIYTDKEHTFNADVDFWFLTRVKWLK